MPESLHIRLRIFWLFNLALTLELRGTEMLVKVLCGGESFKVVGVSLLVI